MKNDNTTGLVILLIIFAVAILGGFKNAKLGLFGVSSSQQNKTTNIEKEIKDAQKDTEELKKQIQELEDEKTHSKYWGLVTITGTNHSTNPNNEYLTLRVSDKATTSISITGWRLQSLVSGSGSSIPEGTLLYFSNSINSEENIFVYKGDKIYVITGISPNGYSFRVNKCSGYLTQFQTYVPSISKKCPRAKDEGISYIPQISSNDDCIDYIESFPRCKVETKTLSNSWTYECKKFIIDRLNYPYCVNNHKNDSDFYQKDWRIYLEKSQTIWKSKREKIVLYDIDNKVVDIYEY